jgi:transposase InsO family protein
MCEALNISRSSFYNYTFRKQESKRYVENAILLCKIKSIYLESKCRYGSPRITAVLRTKGIKAGKNRVARIMKLNSISVKVRQKRRNYLKSKERQINTDLVVRQFNPVIRNRIWGSDITYIKTRQGWKYLIVIMDLYSRMIIAWKVNDSQDESIIVRTIEIALKNRNPVSGLIFHSDRGSQYCSARVRYTLECNGISQSMGAKATCYDNAVLESFFSTLKKELIYREKYRDMEDLQKSLFEYIEIFYNRQRRHSTLGYLSPFEFESKNAIN